MDSDRPPDTTHSSTLWAMTVALFLVCVLLTLVLFRYPDPYVAVGGGVTAVFAATDAVGRLFGRGRDGSMSFIMRFMRSLPATLTDLRA